MKNILLYTDTPQAGGAELQMFLLAKFLDKEKFTPIFACSKNQSLDKLCENFEKENIRVIRLPVMNKHHPRHYFELKKIIKNEKIDLIHIHVWNPASGRYGFLAADSANIPIVTTEHDPFQLNFLKDAFKKFTLNKVSKIITVSEENAKVLKKLYPKHSKKISVIHNGLDLTWWQSQLLRFTNEDRKEVKEKIFKAKEDTLIITTIAELHERKGLKYLIEAMPSLTSEFPNIKLVIIGEGNTRPNLENQIKKLNLEANIILLGRQKEIPKLLKSSDIFALPSLREAFGLVLTEAMFIPLPIVATKVGGIPEVVVDKKTGLLVDPKDPQSLAKALRTLISDPKKRAAFASTGFSRVIKNFDAKRMAEEYGKAYNSIIFP